MKKRVLVVLFLFLISLSTSYSQDSEATINLPPDKNTIKISLLEKETKKPIANAIVILSIIIKQKEHSFEVITNNQGEFVINSFGEDQIFMTLKTDLLETPGKDYYGDYVFENGLINDVEIELFKVGSIKGLVLDNLDNLVNNAEMKFDCTNNLGENYPRTTDKFGSFNYEYSPIGNCRVFANFNDGAGFLDVIVGHGQISQIEVKLDKSIINYKRKISLWPLIVFILIAGASIFLITNKKEAKFEKNKIETKPHLSQPGNRTNDIMRTLDFKEQNVVKYLMEKNCRITQNEISREVGIPKTSLIRVIENLEKKHIIDVEKIGKFKKLELTNWFLGKSI